MLADGVLYAVKSSGVIIIVIQFAIARR